MFEQRGKMSLLRSTLQEIKKDHIFEQRRKISLL